MKTVSYHMYELSGICELGIVLKHKVYDEIDIVKNVRYIFNDKGDSLHIFFRDGEPRVELERKVVTSTSSQSIAYGITHIFERLRQYAFRVQSV